MFSATKRPIDDPADKTRRQKESAPWYIPLGINFLRPMRGAVVTHLGEFGIDGVNHLVGELAIK